MKTILTVDALKYKIGSTIQDPYGRILGRLVSVESEVDGTVVSVAVEAEDKGLRFYPAKALKIQDGKLVVWPEWKVFATDLIASYQTALRRIKGLEEMRRRDEVSSVVYGELKKKLDASLNKLKEEARKLKEMMKRRLNELEDEALRVERAIASLKVSYLAGEVPDNVYKTAINALRAARDTIDREVEDIKNTLSRLESVEKGVGIEIRKEQEQASREEQPSIPSLGPQQPVPVKVIDSGGS